MFFLACNHFDFKRSCFPHWCGCLFMCKQSEEERLRDQKEREELEQHIRERDAAGTRKVLVYIPTWPS